MESGYEVEVNPVNNDLVTEVTVFTGRNSGYAFLEKHQVRGLIEALQKALVEMES